MMLLTMAPDFSSYIKAASFSFNSLHFLTKPKYYCIVFFQTLIYQKVRNENLLYIDCKFDRFCGLSWRNKLLESVHIYLFELVPQFCGYFVRVLLLLLFVHQSSPLASQSLTVLCGFFDGYTAHQCVLKPILKSSQSHGNKRVKSDKIKRIEITSKAILWVNIILFMLSIMFLQNQ
ncbi:hypothetical protein AGLY_016035 [Aphis glycines]|uniref:Uncharacterized protein n=1 Tax=Aphis glycines TaxID=307491 RepID=A0A6G0SYN5_APHGL|nr:hypothetical protein AGLY_016035 [Aphis glycines]